MYPERDSRADEIDDAIERRRSGDTTSLNDQELHDLVELASRLDTELPDDLPDPAFRENLKFQLLQGETNLEAGADAPVDLEQERWHRRLIASPWRVGAAAAACLVVIAVALVANAGLPFGAATGGGEEEVTSFQAVDADDALDSDDRFPTDQFPLDVEDGSLRDGEQWFTASFPPFDVEHVVLPPLLIGFLPFADRHRPRVTLNGAEGMVHDVNMPGSASVYYLNAPPDGSTMLTVLSSILGTEGELIEGNGDGEPFRIIDDEGNDILRWDAASAFFHFRGTLLDEPLNDLLEPDAAPDDVALRFLELIGFDLYTIEYESRVIEHDQNYEVQFRPADFPETGLDVTLGGSVYVGNNGTVHEAQLYWLSLVDIEVVSLRDTEDIIQDLEEDAGYAPPAADGSAEMMIDAENVMMVHVLTRLGQSNFVLQPAVKVVGDYGNNVESTLPGQARYLIPAIDNSD